MRKIIPMPSQKVGEGDGETKEEGRKMLVQAKTYTTIWKIHTLQLFFQILPPLKLFHSFTIV
jgi:hypothetical protein